MKFTTEMTMRYTLQVHLQVFLSFRYQRMNYSQYANLLQCFIQKFNLLRENKYRNLQRVFNYFSDITRHMKVMYVVNSNTVSYTAQE